MINFIKTAQLPINKSFTITQHDRSSSLLAAECQFTQPSGTVPSRLQHCPHRQPQPTTHSNHHETAQHSIQPQQPNSFPTHLRWPRHLPAPQLGLATRRCKKPRPDLRRSRRPQRQLRPLDTLRPPTPSPPTALRSPQTAQTAHRRRPREKRLWQPRLWRPLSPQRHPPLRFQTLRPRQTARLAAGRNKSSSPQSNRRPQFSHSRANRTLRPKALESRHAPHNLPLPLGVRARRARFNSLP